MSWFIDLGTPYYPQVNSASCGGAVAQMILASIGAVALIDNGPIDQEALFTLCNYHSSDELDTSPGGLNFTLNAFNRPGRDGGFSVDCVDNELAASTNILRTLCHFGVATGTLVIGCFHWVAVRGAKTNENPVSGDDKVAIEGFYINNPWPPKSPDRGVLGGDIPTGFSNEYVAYAEWKKTYLTGCVEDGQRKFVSVRDSRLPPTRRIEPSGQVRTSTGKRRMSADQAVALANRGLTRHQKSGQMCPFTPVLRGAYAVNAQLVRRLDRNDEYYYLILLHREGAPVAIVRADASNGTLLGVGSLDGVTHVPIISREAAVAAARQAVAGPGDESGRIVLHDGAFHIEETLVWRPCKESRSPYYPFYQITDSGDTIHVGYDGLVCPTLHDQGWG